MGAKGGETWDVGGCYSGTSFLDWLALMQRAGVRCKGVALISAGETFAATDVDVLAWGKATMGSVRGFDRRCCAIEGEQ